MLVGGTYVLLALIKGDLMFGSFVSHGGLLVDRVTSKVGRVIDHD